MVRRIRYVPIIGMAIALLAAPFLFSPSAHANAWEGPPGVHFFIVEAVDFDDLLLDLTLDSNDFAAVAALEAESTAALRTDIYGHGPRWAGRVKLEEVEGFAAYSQPFHNRA